MLSLCYTQRDNYTVRMYDMYILVIIFFLSLFCAFRGDTPDTLQYYYYYQTTPTINTLYDEVSSGRWFFSVEPLFHLLMSIEKTLLGSYEFFLFSVTFFSLLIIYQSYKEYGKKPDLALIVYLSMSFVFLYFVQIRQGISVALTLLGITYIYKGYKIKGNIIIVLSMMIHISAIIVFPVLLVRRFFSITFVVFITPLLVVVLNLLNVIPKFFIEMSKIINFPLLTTKIDLYFISGAKEHTVSLFSIINILSLSILFACWLHRDNMISHFKSERIYAWSQFYTACSVITYNMFPLAQDVGSRFFKQLNIFMPIQIAFLLDSIILSRRNNVNILFRIVIISFVLFYFYREAFNFEVY